MTNKENKLKKNIKKFNEIIEKCNQDILDLKNQNIKNEISESKNINISSKTETSLQQEENK